MTRSGQGYLITEHRFIGRREWGLTPDDSRPCQAPGCGQAKSKHWALPPPEDPYWNESLHASRDYLSPHTAAMNILNRDGTLDWDKADDLVTAMLDHIWEHGYKIVRDYDRPGLNEP